MTIYKLFSLAKEDLRLIAWTISELGISEYGRAQAEKYVTLLHDSMIQIANTLAIGKNRPELFDKARSFPVQKYVVFCWKAESGIEIARILHKGMDPQVAFE